MLLLQVLLLPPGPMSLAQSKSAGCMHHVHCSMVIICIFKLHLMGLFSFQRVIYSSYSYFFTSLILYMSLH